MESARLLVAAPDGTELQYILEVEQVVIGRDEGCTVVLSRKGVSRRHARVQIGDDGATVEDLGSTNGTRLNGRLLEPGPHRLAGGDCIEIGKVELRYVAPRPDDRAPDCDPAMQTQLQTVFEEGRLTAFVSHDPTLLDTAEVDAALLTVVVGAATGPRLQIRERGRTHEIRLNDLAGEAVIGRSPDCRIRLADRKASNRHAAFTRADDGFVVRDLGSRNGTLVNGIAVTEHRLAPHDVVRIGDAALFYVDESDLDGSGHTQPSTKRPVVLLPGFAGTELWKGDKQVWPAKLAMLTRNEKEMRRDWEGAMPRGLVEEVCVVPGLAKHEAFGKLLRFVREELGYESPDDMLEFPYDWRRSNVESAQGLAAAIRSWREKRRSPTERVTIVAYSMGGIVTRLGLARQGLTDAVERVLFLGTPHSGTPQAVQTVVAGVGMLPFNIGLQRIRRLALSFDSFYELFPTFHCVDLEDGSPFVPYENGDWLPEEHRAQLENGAKVRRLLDAQERLPVPATCIIGFDQRTLERLVVRRQRDGSIVQASEQRTRCGDGQVPEESAVLEGSDIQPVRQQHGALYSDRDVLRRLRYELLERPRGVS